MLIMKQICKCDVCGYEWLPQGESLPMRCSSSKCKSRAWNKGESRSPVKTEEKPPIIEETSDGEQTEPNPVTAFKSFAKPPKRKKKAKIAKVAPIRPRETMVPITPALTVPPAQEVEPIEPLAPAMESMTLVLTEPQEEEDDNFEESVKIILDTEQPVRYDDYA